MTDDFYQHDYIVYFFCLKIILFLVEFHMQLWMGYFFLFTLL